MNEHTKKILQGIIALIVFAVCIWLVVAGQRHIGPAGLGVMLIGLAGLVVLLWLYNRKFK